MGRSAMVPGRISGSCFESKGGGFSGFGFMVDEAGRLYKLYMEAIFVD